MNAIQIESERDSQNSMPPPARAGRSLEVRLLQRILQGVGNPNIEMVLWNGAVVRPGDTHAGPLGRVHIRDRATLYGLMRDTQVHFGDAYSEGRIEIEGDLVQLLEAVYRARAARSAQGRAGAPAWTGCMAARAARARTRSPVRARTSTITTTSATISTRCGSGETMAYTCAYYPTPAATLDEAQVAKMDHVCRKLRLRAGETRRRGGLRLGRARAAHGAALRREGARLQHLAASRSVGARARARSRPRRPRRVRRGRLPQHQRARTMPSCRSACSSTWARELPGARAPDRARARRRTAAASSTPSGATARARCTAWIETTHLPRRLSAVARAR